MLEYFDTHRLWCDISNHIKYLIFCCFCFDSNSASVLHPGPDSFETLQHEAPIQTESLLPLLSGTLALSNLQSVRQPCCP
jgi:hypothetical protein